MGDIGDINVLSLHCVDKSCDKCILEYLDEECDADTLFDREQRRALINSIQDISAVKAADVQLVKQVKDMKENNWISCKDELPPDLVPVNIVWTNRNPISYYADIKDKPFVATGVYFKGHWYWWSAACVNILEDALEEGYTSYENIVNDCIDILYWMPLPEPPHEKE